MFIVNGWVKSIEIDDYEDGYIGDYSLISGNDTFTSDNLDILLKTLKAFTGHDGLDIEGSEGEVSIQGLEKGDGYPATEKEIGQWKKGEIRLWSVRYTFFVYEASLYNFGE